MYLDFLLIGSLLFKNTHNISGNGYASIIK